MKHHPLIRAAAKISKIKAADILTSLKQEPTAWRHVIMATMRQNGMTLAEIAAATKRDTSTVCSSCQKLDKLKDQSWFIRMRDKLTDEASDVRKQQAKHERLNRFCENIPPRVYMAAFACAD